MNRIQTTNTQAYALKTAIMLLLLCLAAGSANVLAADAGRFFVVVGDVRVVSANGRSQRAVRGSSLSTGDTVFTGGGALAQIMMIDEGRISLRANTEFKLEDYNFKKAEPSTGRMFINLLRGSLRSLTGLIGRRNRAGYRLRTPHATLGIRGTDHETTVLLQPREGFQPGTFDVVFSGGTVMRTARGEINIAPRQAGYVTAASLRPTVIDVPKFLRTTQRASRPSTSVPSPKTNNKDAPSERSTGAAKNRSNAQKKLDKKPLLLTPLSNPRASSGATRSSSTPKASSTKILRTPSLTPGRNLQPGTPSVAPSLNNRPTLTTPTIPRQTPSLTTPRAPTLTTPVPRAPVPGAPIIRAPITTAPATRTPTPSSPPVTTVPVQPAPTLRNPNLRKSPGLIQQSPSSR